MKKLIMLAGAKRSGKDTTALLLKQLDPSIKLVSFAGPMKQIISTTFAIDPKDLEDWKNDGTLLLHGIPPEDQDGASFQMQSYREILQLFGTEAMKPIFGNDVWVQVAIKFIDHHFNTTDIVVITDFRYPEEYHGLYNYYTEPHLVTHGGEAETCSIDITTIKIKRDGLLSSDSHSSENSLKEFPFDNVIENDGTLEELKQKLEIILGEINE